MRWRAFFEPTRIARGGTARVLLAAWSLSLAAPPRPAEALEVAPPEGAPGPGGGSAAPPITPAGAPHPHIDAGAGPDAEDDPGPGPDFAAGRGAVPPIEVTRSEVLTDPPAVPGARMILRADRSFEGGRFHWSQLAGPTVAIDDPAGPSIQITIPTGAEELEFLLVAAKGEAVRVVRVSVPIRGASDASWGSDAARASWGERPSGGVKADAGDDQVGLIGHRVTLNGSGSVPASGKNARWVQVAGPPVIAPRHQGPFFSFVPSGAGLYRFLLVVAGEGEVSEPDEVSVLVGSPPAQATAAAAVAAPAPAPAVTPEAFLAGVLPRLAESGRVAGEVADVMEAISGRAELYSAFAELHNELVRRIDVVVPADPSRRAEWSQTVFGPLTSYTAGQLLTAGVDLRQPQGYQQPLTPAQRLLLRDHFLRLARAFRASASAPVSAPPATAP